MDTALLGVGKVSVGVEGTRLVCALPLFFHGSSPVPKAKFIGAFARCHHLGKIGIQSCTDFFETDGVRSEFSLRPNGMELQTLQNTNQAVHVQIPEANVSKGIGFVHFRTISAVGQLFGFLGPITASEECSKCGSDTRIAERPRVLPQGTNIRPVFS